MAILKKIKMLEAVLDSTANPAHLPKNLTKLAVMFSWYYSKTASRILIFSIVLGAEYSFYVKSITTYAPKKLT